jgi:hypothetical protein
LAFDHCGVNAAAMIKHQSQRCELLPDIGKNEQENKPKTIFTAGLDKVGFIEAPLIAQWKLEYSKRAFLDAEEIKARTGALLDF